MVRYIGADGNPVEGPLPAGEARAVIAWDDVAQEDIEVYVVNGGGGSGTQVDATIDAGTATITLPAIASASMPMSAGAGDSTLAAGPSILVQTPPATGQSVTTRSGKTWTTPANALGQANGTEATITGSASTTTADGFDADLVLSFGGLGNPGGSRTGLVLEVTHRYTPASGTGVTLGTTSSSFAIDLLDGATSIATLFTIAGGGTARAALATDTYDLTSVVGARAPAQVAALTLRFRATAVLQAAVGGTASWAVDAARLKMTSQLGAPT